MADASRTLADAPVGLRATRMALAGDELVVFSFPADQAALEALLGRLTSAERSVALRMLDGLSNREIAVARGTSARTVTKQVENVFRKVGVRSRAELAAKLVQPSR